MATLCDELVQTENRMQQRAKQLEPDLKRIRLELAAQGGKVDPKSPGAQFLVSQSRANQQERMQFFEQAVKRLKDNLGPVGMEKLETYIARTYRFQLGKY